MTISEDLMMSILALDSCNRGYDAGIVLSGTQLGTANLQLTAMPDGFQAASFFAQAYTLDTGQTVISRA